MIIRKTLVATLLLALAAPALADDAGPGGSKPVDPVGGEQVYKQVCQACHMADGKGATGAATIPALAGNPKLAVAAYPITIVLKGKGAMPWFNGVLTPKQIAGVVEYARTHFGNAYPGAVSETLVTQIAGPAPHDQH